ncbi:MAG: hypothetical protein H6R30_350, partial [Methanomicrobia archaeon]|nr:hypothetical protein [Methanomicrobia archaeon]
MNLRTFRREDAVLYLRMVNPWARCGRGRCRL